MTRLADRFRRSTQMPYLPSLSDFGSFLATSYGTPDREMIARTFRSYAVNGYGQNGILFGVIGLRMSLFTEASFCFRDRRRKNLFGAATLGLLEEPWPGGTTGDLLARAEQDVSLAGNFFVRSVEGVQLERLQPDLVTIVSELAEDRLGRPHRRVVGYAYDAGQVDPARNLETYDVTEVAHWAPIPDPLALHRGMSWMTPILREIDADTEMIEHKLKFLRNGATPNLLLKYQRRLSPDQKQELRDQFDARHSGTMNAGRALVLEDGADASVIGADLKALSIAEVQAAGAARVGFVGGVPSELMPAAATGRSLLPDTAYAAAIRRFADMWGRPQWRSLCSALSNLVEVPGGAQLWYDTTDIAALQPGEQDIATTMQLQMAGVNVGIMAGFDPDALIQAAISGDLSLLLGKHSGLASVQMQSISGASEPADKADPALQDNPQGTDQQGVKP